MLWGPASQVTPPLLFVMHVWCALLQRNTPRFQVQQLVRSATTARQAESNLPRDNTPVKSMQSMQPCHNVTCRQQHMG